MNDLSQNNGQNLCQLSSTDAQTYSQLPPQKQTKIHQLRQWMKQKGCIIHPNVQIPSFVNGYQGVGTKGIIPPKTVVIAVPSSLILTVTKCYKDPELKSIFTKNDNLFDYEASDDCEFNVLCVFLMYHKLNIDKSPWRIYLQTIGEPQTAIDWADKMLKGLNKSAIEEILHVRIQCDKLRDQLSSYLKTTKQFSQFTIQQIKQCFNYCYRAVMTRCFGYYFGQASLIPVADLINHGCEVVNHQLINIRYEKNLQYCEGYKQKSDKIDCELLGIKRGKHVLPPFRQRFLMSNQLIDGDMETLASLDRKKIDSLIAEYNQKLFKQEQTIDIEGLEFCQEDDSEDNDTDVDEQTERQLELQRMHLQEMQQIENFKKYHDSIKVETYKQVEERFEKYEQELNKQNFSEGAACTPGDAQIGESRNDLLIKGVNIDKGDLTINAQQRGQHKNVVQDNQADWEDEDETQIINNTKDSQKTKPDAKNNNDNKLQCNKSQSTQNQQSLYFPHTIVKASTKPQAGQTKEQKQSQNHTKQTHKPRAIVPIQMIESSQSESEDDEEWGLEPDSYFTLSTSSAVGKGKQLYNSYGSRTNKFLLVWYGFCYPNNLYDSVALRLHVQWHKNLPSAQSIVLDTYIGGQGLTFRKNQKEVVKGNEVSKQFRLKRNKVCLKLLTFLRLYLLDYYKGNDLYKVCVTLPSSVQFEIFVLQYYKSIVLALYERYPLGIIEQLRQQLQSGQVSQSDKQKIRFKLIYLQEQRKILDQSVDSVECLIKVWGRVKHSKQQQYKALKQIPTTPQFDKSYYRDLTIHQLRKLKPYLTALKKNYSYVMYEHEQQP